MKRILLLSLFTFLATIVNAQSIDVIYLKNGSIIMGDVIEMNPTENIKIKTADGSLFVYSMADVEKMEKQEKQETENVSDSSSSNSLPLFSQDSYSHMIEKKGRELYWVRGGLVPYNQLKELLGDDMYRTYLDGQKHVKVGNSCLDVGIGFALAAVAVFISASSEDSGDKFVLGEILCVPADIFIGIGCTLRGIGNGQLRWVQNTYNSMSKQTASISIKPSLMLSHQNDIALGATFSLNF